LGEKLEAQSFFGRASYLSTGKYGPELQGKMLENTLPELWNEMEAADVYTRGAV